MASLSTAQLLADIQHVCYQSALVGRVEVLSQDADILQLRVHLTTEDAFINVFFNITTDKTAFALIQGGVRLFGADNAKSGWHRHPFNNPSQHLACSPLTFNEVLNEIETHFIS